jgi:hypothetical protein
MDYGTQTIGRKTMQAIIGLLFPAFIGCCVAHSLWNQISDVLDSLTAIL